MTKLMPFVEVLRQIESYLPCRTQELKVLNALLHIDEEYLHDLPDRGPGLILYGPHQAGKTALLQALLQASDEHNYAYIDCKRCTSSRSLFEYTIDEIISRDLFVNDDGTLIHESSSIDNLGSFLSTLERVLSTDEQRNKILVFDHISSKLYDDYESIVETIVSLFERSASAHTAVFVISNYQDVPKSAMTTLLFPCYSVEELCIILQETVSVKIDIQANRLADAEELKGLWSRFCKILVSAFFDTFGQDIDLYRITSQRIFPDYLAPIRDNILSAKNHVQLARSSHDLFMPEKWILTESSLVHGSSTIEKMRTDELSICARYLLVAAFLASYNPGKTDRIFFSRGKGEKTKRRGGKRAMEKIAKQSQKLLGPKGFALDRMLSIFQAIVPSTYPHTALLDQQIASLFSLKLLLKQGSSSDLLDDGKWVVNVNLETIIKIARSVNFELNRFLVTD